MRVQIYAQNVCFISMNIRCCSPEKIVECGMANIPTISRLYEKLENVVKKYRDGVSYDDFFKDFHNRYDEYKPHDAYNRKVHCE